METTPDFTTGEEVSGDQTETSSADSPPEDREEFNERVERLCQMMRDDPGVRDRIIAETYVNIASAEMGIRGMYESFQAQGMAGIMRGAFKRGS